MSIVRRVLRQFYSSCVPIDKNNGIFYIARVNVILLVWIK